MPTRTPHRAKRDVRSKTPRPMRLTLRDYEILAAVYLCRVLTTAHIQQLFFSSLHKTYARLNKLFHHGFVDRKFLGVAAAKMNTPILYVLDRRGAEALLAQGYEITWHRRHKQVTTLFLQHTLALNTLRVLMVKACQVKGYRLLEWRSENELKASYDRIYPSKSKNPVAVIPDSYCAIETLQGTVHLFWELDRGTMPSKRFKQKVAAYLAYARSDLALRRFHTNKFRVLTVTESSTRCLNLKRATESMRGKNRFWFSVLEDLTPATILTDPVWQVADRGEKVALLL
jgi:Replication-relaxation